MKAKTGSVLLVTSLVVLPCLQVLAGDPSNFVSPCEPMPQVTTPHDGDNTNDGGWLLVDFCTAGATGTSPAEPPDCHHNDDDSALVALPFTFFHYLDGYVDVFINNNGNLSFGDLFSEFTSTGFPVEGFPMVAPFWADIDTGDQLDPDILGHVWQKQIGANTFAVTWDSVAFYPEDPSLNNTFQILISDGSNPVMGLGNNVCFCYDDMQWTTGGASGGVGGFGGTPATVGANRGDGVDFFLIGLFDHPGTDYDGPGGLPDGVDYLDGLGTGVGSPVCFNASGSNIPPIASGFPPNNEIVLGCDDVLDLSIGFLSPEASQITTVTISDPDGAQSAGLVINNTPGNIAAIDLDWTVSGADDGLYALTFTAVDDGLPPEQTIETLAITVDCLSQVEIDIKPGSDPNCLHIDGKGVVPVAILGNSDLDVSHIDAGTLLFNGLPPGMRGNGDPQCRVADSNNDEFLDLICQFADVPGAWIPAQTEACVTGFLLSTWGGQSFEGCDSICLVPPTD